MRLLLVDHYDSFTGNLAHLLAVASGQEPTIVQHDDPSLPTLDWSAFDAVVLSPGPGHPARPEDARHTAEALRPGRPPVLGVCLGMQLLAHAEGARVARAPEPRHGRTSRISHVGDPLFADIPSPFAAVRYHSLACDDLPPTLAPLAWSEDGVLMALRHRERPWWGVQFHPESIATEHGRTLVANFLRLAGLPDRAPLRAPPPPPRAPDPSPAPLHRVLDGVPDLGRLHDARFAAPSVWLDGAAAGTRFSLLGDAAGPLAEVLTYRAVDGNLTVQRADGIATRTERLWDHLRARLASPAAPVPGLDLPFSLGYCGYLGYELRHDAGSPVARPSPLPDAALLFLDRAVVVDHAHRRTWLLALDHPDNRRWLETMASEVAAFDEPVRAPLPTLRPAPTPAWRHDRAAYLDRVRRCLAHLADGDSYELCLTNRARVPCADPAAAYRRLRATNPAPFAALLDFGSFAVLSSSPERFVRVERDGRVTAEPIKGTRRREHTPEADDAACADLAGSEKDRAENLMITDLLRNDLSRVCSPGSVEVPRLFAVESYARVHQMVSTITGRLRPHLAAIDAIEAAFPPGSMTGAPKLRSMALLDALEGEPRGPYAGALGYLSRCGAADLSVVIRTAVVRDGEATVGAGGAVVALSRPEDEVAEAELKAEAVIEAVADRRDQ